MNPQDSVSVARRAMDVEDYIDILRRHKSWIFGPTFAALVMATVVAFLWPDTYLSMGTLRVVPPTVPESYVPSNLNSDLQGRFNSMVQGLLSRTSLQAIIQEFDLYKNELKREPLEDVIEDMRRNGIKIKAVEGVAQANNAKSQPPAFPAFQVGFAYTNRFTAKRVADKLIANLLLENQKETTQVTKETTDFLQQSWEDAKKKLDDFESKLSTFRQHNLGRLPEQQQTNFNQLTAIQTQLLNLNTSMGRVNQEKLLLENQWRIYKDQLSQLKDPTPQQQVAQQKNEKLAEKERLVNYLETTLASYRERYKESHPDIQSLEVKLAEAKKERDEFMKEEANKKPEPVAERAASSEFLQKQGDLNAAIKRMQGLMEAKDLEMQGYQNQVNELNAELKAVQERLAGMPVGLKEYEELARDRDLAKQEYENLDKRLKNSTLSTRVIENQEGERLEQIEEASTPLTPTEPKRPLIVLAGAGAGLIVGLFLAGAREVKDTSLKNLKDVRAYTQLSILGSIPLLENDLIVKRRRRLAWLAWATACLMGLVVMSGSVVYYYATKL